MTIDKFGRSLKSTSRKDVKGPKGDGFNLTSDGDFDITGKRLVNLGEPKAGHDAVTKIYSDRHYLKADNEGYNLRRKRLKNVGDPKHDTDAVNLFTVKRMCLRREGMDFDADKKLITNLIDPVNPHDAATKKYVDILKNELSDSSIILDKHQSDITNIKEKMSKFEGLIASNKDYHDKNLRKFGVLIFNYINKKHTGRSAILLTAGEGEYNWDELFSEGSENTEIGNNNKEENKNVDPIPYRVSLFNP